MGTPLVGSGVVAKEEGVVGSGETEMGRGVSPRQHFTGRGGRPSQGKGGEVGLAKVWRLQVER
jgi:hypothetical protein